MGPLNNFQRLSILVAASADPALEEKWVDVAMVSRWVAEGNEWALSWKYDFFETEEHPLTQAVEETRHIFDMYRQLQRVDVATLESVGLNSAKVVFPGFDGNNDEHYTIASVLVNDLKRYTDIKGATANSGTLTSVGRYKRMLEKFRALNRSAVDWEIKPLTAEEVVKILE